MNNMIDITIPVSITEMRESVLNHITNLIKDSGPFVLEVVISDREAPPVVVGEKPLLSEDSQPVIEKKVEITYMVLRQANTHDVSVQL